MLKAAQYGGDIDRTAFVKALESKNPHISKRIAQSSLFIPKGRSGIRHLMKNTASAEKSGAPKRTHHHDLMRKYYRGRPTNGVKSHIRLYAATK